MSKAEVEINLAGEMELEIQAAHLQKPINALSHSLKDCAVGFYEDKVKIGGIDESHICLIVVELSSGAFEGYSATGELILPISLEELAKILSRAKKSDILELSYKSGANRINIVVQQPDEDRWRKKYALPLTRTTVSPYQTPPKMEPGAKVSFSSLDWYAEAIADTKIVSEKQVQLSKPADQDCIYFRASEAGGIKMETIWGPEDDVIVETTGEEVSVSYGVPFLEDLTKFKDISGDGTMIFGTEKPVLFEIELMIGKDAIGSLVYMLAPRVESTID